MTKQPDENSNPPLPGAASLPGAEQGRLFAHPEARAQRHAPQRIPRWLVTAELLLRVLVRVFVGLVICYAPWSGRLLADYPTLLFYLPRLNEIWDMNPLFLHFPALGHYAAMGAVRGMVSGLGVLNLWIALHDLLDHRIG
jgi:hypothetical protein